MKQIIRLTESQLAQLIKETTKKILSEELDWRTLRNASDKAFEKASDPTVTDWERQRRQNQADTFLDAANERFRTQYGIDDIQLRKAKHEKERSLGKDVGDFKYTNGELKRLDRRERDKNDFFSGKQEYRDGRWQNKIATDEAINRIVKESVNKILDEVRFGGESLHNNPTDWSTIEKMRDFKMDNVPMSLEKHREHGRASLRDLDNALEGFRKSQDPNIHPDIYRERWRDMRDNASKKVIRMQKNLGLR